MNDYWPTAADVPPLIVVGTDFSTGARRALDEGRRLARRLEARLEVVHVADGFHVRAWDPLPASERWLADAGIPTGEMSVRYGVPWVELVRHTEMHGAAFLVVGSQGASGFHSVGIGTTASRVATQARCPVVLVSGRVELHKRTDGTALHEGVAALARQNREPIMETGQ